jgi:glycyl-tRNA synthetase (class II)
MWACAIMPRLAAMAARSTRREKPGADSAFGSVVYVPYFKIVAPAKADCVSIPGVPTIGGRDCAYSYPPMGAALRENPERAETVADAVRDLLSKYATPKGVLMPAAVWIVSAHSENRL